MKKFLRRALTAIFIVACMISTSICVAATLVESTKEYASIGVKRDHNLFVDIQKNPSRYICIGGVGTGVSVYIDRESIDVQQYEPPIYIIAFKKVYWSVQPDKNLPEGYGAAAGSEIERYKYNYAERKMYNERRYRDGRPPEWDFIDPERAGTSGARSWGAGGEIAFYLAYNMSFYDKPFSWNLQSYLEKGTWQAIDGNYYR